MAPDLELASIVFAATPTIAVVHRDSGSGALVTIVVRGPSGRAEFLADIDIEYLTKGEVEAEPRPSSSLAVWSNCVCKVAIGGQIRILAHFDDAGAVPR